VAARNGGQARSRQLSGPVGDANSSSGVVGAGDPVIRSVAVYKVSPDQYEATRAPKLLDRVERFAGSLRGALADPRRGLRARGTTPDDERARYGADSTTPKITHNGGTQMTDTKQSMHRQLVDRILHGPGEAPAD
jgi:hypothetical protein